MAKYKFIQKENTPNSIWDNGIICRFSDGVFETDDEDIANRLISFGIEFERLDVQDETDMQTDDEESKEMNNQTDDVVDLNKLSVDELKKYAKDKNIDLDGINKKADIIKVLEGKDNDWRNKTKA